eukprot:scaffold368674_cov48-Prasinocladus_malaysianus.AAC.1
MSWRSLSYSSISRKGDRTKVRAKRPCRAGTAAARSSVNSPELVRILETRPVRSLCSFTGQALRRSFAKAQDANRGQQSAVVAGPVSAGHFVIAVPTDPTNRYSTRKSTTFTSTCYES